MKEKDWDEIVGILSEGEAIELQQGGFVIPESGMDTIMRASLWPMPSAYRPKLPPAKPLTRRQKLRLRWMDWRWRFVTAAEVLAGRHECD